MPPQKKRKKLAEEKENEIAGVAVGKRSALELELDARPTIVLGAGGGWTGHVYVPSNFLDVRKALLMKNPQVQI